MRRTNSLLLLLIICYAPLATIATATHDGKSQHSTSSWPSTPEWGTLGPTTTTTTTTTSSSADDWENKENHQGVCDVDDEVDIAIIGAGPAGLATAIGLLRSFKSPQRQESQATNLKIRIYERSPELRTESQGMLSLWSCGMAFLSRIHPDLPQVVQEAGCPLETSTRIKVVKTSKDDGTTGGGNDGDENYITKNEKVEVKAEPGTTLIRWHSLCVVLANLLSDMLRRERNESEETILIGSHSLVTYKEIKGTEGNGGTSSDGVLLKFENGNIVRAKIVIGSDGTFSSVRRTMHPNDRPIYFGQMNWNAIIPTNTLEESARPKPNGVTYLSHDDDEPARWTAFVNDCGGNHTFFQLRITDMEKARALSGSKGRGGLGLRGVKDSLFPIVKMSSHLTSVFEALPEEIIFERAIVGCSPLSTWLSPGGRVALLGDAAHGMHPAPGQGANQALGSAATLVECIQSSFRKYLDEGKKVESLEWLVDGLKAYDADRRPRMDWLQRYVNMIGCRQSSGAGFPLDTDSGALWAKWVLSEDHVPPPNEGRDIVKSFDPLSIPEVSLL